MFELLICEGLSACSPKSKISLPEKKKGHYLKPFIAKYLDEKNLIPSTIAIYEDKVLNIIWEKEPLAVLFTSEKISESYKNYFTLLWKIAKK